MTRRYSVAYMGNGGNDMNDNEKLDRLAYSVTEAAQVLSLGKTTVYGLMASGKLPYCEIGSLRRIRSADLHDLLVKRPDAA
jgi:excisionase family DNA binding protein